jgi:tetratricopeptide (TPR) repeat protein
MKKNCVIRLWGRSLLLVGLLGAGIVFSYGQTAASGQPTVQSQLENARALEQRSRMDLAVPIWKRVLETEPTNTEALAGLARAAALKGDSTLATMYLDKLRAINPKDPQIARIEKIKPLAASGKDKLAWQGPAEDRAHRVLSPEEAAYQSLHTNRIAEAESRFRAILKRQPNDASALAGMGYVRLQQQNYTAAIGFLERAKQKRPGDQAVTEALETARFRFIVSEGNRSLAAGDAATAEKRFRSALELRRDSPEALAGLGETLLARNDAAAAVPMFERAIAAQPAMQSGWRGLVFAATASGNAQAAISADERMPDAVHTALHADPGYLQALASSQLLAGRGGDAQGSLDTALRVSTDDASKRSIETQLGGVLLVRNEPQRAAEVYRQLTTSDAGNIAAWQGLIQAQHAIGQNDEALATAERMPAPVREQATRQPGFAVALAQVYRAEKRLDIAQDLLQRGAKQPSSAGDRTHTALVLELASVDIESGQPQLAYPLYLQVLREQPERADAWAGLLATLHLTGHDREAIEQAGLIPPGVRAQLAHSPAYLETMGAAYAATGRPEQAAQLARSEVSGSRISSATAPADVAIENAWLLYTSGNDTALYPELMTLGGRSDLNEMQRKSVQTIWADWALRQANHSADTGGTAHALAILNAASEEFAANAEVQRALAPGFVRAGDAQRADAIFKAQNMASASAADYQTAISAAMAANDAHSADTWLRSALAKYPSDPQILLLKGRYEQARGDTKQAQQYYEQSLKAMPPAPRAGSEAPLPSASLASGQRLAALLAPAGMELNTAVTAAPSSVPSPPQPSPAQTAAKAEGYNPFTPYIAPSRPTPAPNITSATGKAEVPVQLGNNAAPPVQQPTEMTDVLPTARYVPNTRRPASLASDPNAAAAEAERVRRQRAEEASRRGQVHTQPEQAANAGPLVPQPAAKPSESREVPDTGAQQYPQPRTPPSPARRNAGRLASAAETANTSAPAVAPAAVPPPIAAPAPVTPPPAPSPVFLPAPEPQVATGTVVPGLLAAQAPIGTATPRQQAQTALTAIDGSYSGFAGGMGFGRFRNGTAGLDRLVDIETPIEASLVAARTVRITAVAQPVFLNSGVLGGNSVAPLTVPYLGRMPSNSTVVPPQQFSNGVGGELQLATRYFGVAAGYTPYQFLVHNITGRIQLTPLGEHLMFYGERQPVKDTQLSYAGLRDPGVSATAGPVWGGVAATGGGLHVAGGSPTSSVGLTAEAGVVTGRHVQKNTFLRGSAEGQFRIKSWKNGGSLALGGLFEGMHYQRNQYGLSYGQGGYFSPAYYFGGAVPVRIRGGGDTNFHYDVEASGGVRTFRQDAAALFPLDAGLQGSFVSCGAGAPSYTCGYYPQVVSTGFEYAVRGEFSYRFRERWYAGGFVRSTNRNNYQDVAAGFSLRYTFRRQASAEGRPTGLFVTEGIRPLQIP